MKKLIGLSLGLFALLAVGSGQAYAGSAVRAPKPHFTMPFASTTVSTVTLGPGALYEVTMSSGASGEFVMIFDSASATGLASTIQSASTITWITPHLLYGSTSAGTQVVFDPPLFFENGMMAVDSAGTGGAIITYEPGRGLSGN